MKKRILATLLAITLLCVLGVTASAATLEPQFWITLGENWEPCDSWGSTYLPETGLFVAHHGTDFIVVSEEHSVFNVKAGTRKDYTYVNEFSDGFAMVEVWSGSSSEDSNCKSYFIDQTGREVFLKYDDVSSFSEGLAAVKLGGKWGYIDTTGKEIVPFQYDEAGAFSDGLAVVRIGDYRTGKAGVIDKMGQEVVPIGKYDGVERFSEGLARVFVGDPYEGGKYGYIDKTGQEVIPCQYDHASYSFHNGLASVRVGGYKTGKWGAIDQTGRVVVPFNYQDFSNEPYRSEGMIMVRDFNYNCGFVNEQGEEVVPCKYGYAEPFSEGLSVVWIRVGDDLRYGYVDQTGKEVIPTVYGHADSFVNGIARVGIATGGMDDWYDPICVWGYIDKTGRTVIPTQYDALDRFDQGIARAGRNGKYGWIDEMGQEVIPLQYDGASAFSDGLAVVGLDSGKKDQWGNTLCKWGYIDKTGRQVIPCQYDEAWSFSDGLAWVRNGNQWGIISLRTAYPSTQSVEVDGKAIEFQCYALKDENGNDTNYIKLRDLADILNGSAAQFEVGWDGDITITTGQAYTKNGSEQNTPFSGQREYQRPAVKTMVNGKETPLDTFQLKDDNGGGYTYYKLRDLGAALGITVDWAAERGIYIETK